MERNSKLLILSSFGLSIRFAIDICRQLKYRRGTLFFQFSNQIFLSQNTNKEPAIMIHVRTGNMQTAVMLWQHQGTQILQLNSLCALRKCSGVVKQ